MNITSLSSSEDTKIWMYYNNSGCSNQQNPTGVWDSNFLAVYHLNQDPTGTVNDSTSNGNHLTSGGSMTSNDLVDGKIRYAIDFDGNDDRLQSGASEITFESFTILTLLTLNDSNVIQE